MEHFVYNTPSHTHIHNIYRVRGGGRAETGLQMRPVPVHRIRTRERDSDRVCVQRERKKESNEHVYNPGSYFSLYTFILH